MAKWVEVTPGYYRLVKDDDPRPAIKIKSSKKLPHIFTNFSPSWRKYEQNFWTPDPEKKTSDKVTDQFLAERDHEMKTNPQAKKWEESRKKEWAKNKPAWRKKMMKEGLI